MKKLLIATLATFAFNASANELVTNAEIIGVSTPVEIDNSDIALIVTVKGGEGICAGKEIKFPLIEMKANLYFEVIKDTIYAGFANSAKVTIGNYKGKQDCQKATYIKLSK